MFLQDTRTYPPLYTLPRWKRRVRLKRIIAARKKERCLQIPLGLRLFFGWQVGVPVCPERYIQTVYYTGRYSVRGKIMPIPIFRLQDYAIDEVIASKDH